MQEDMVEREVRTDFKGMLVCKAVPTDNGDYDLVKKCGKKKDTISVSSFLTQVYGKPVTILMS